MKVLFLYIFLFLFSCPLYAQDADAVYYGKRYVSLRLSATEKYASRLDRQQQKLLKRLKDGEARLLRKAAQLKDSAIAQRLHTNTAPSFDSISRMLHPDSTALAHKGRMSINRTLDTIKGVQSFINQQNTGVNASLPVADQTARLKSLQQKLAWQQYLNGLIEQRGKQLQNLASESGSRLPGLSSIQKTLYYGRSRMAAYKQMADDPSLAEEKALEYLQGTEGFSAALKRAGSSAGSSMQSANSVEDLERMGFQTRRQIAANLKDRFGDNISAVQQSMASQVGDWQKAAQAPLAKVKEAKQQLSDIRSDLNTTRSGIKGMRQPAKLSFKPNPMRGLPFRQRIEKSYSYNVRRPDGAKSPALLEVAAMAGFRHTPKLSYGVGIAGSLGLGKDWNSVHLTFEGIGLRSYAAWQWVWGIGGYAGYERVYKQAVFNSSDKQQEVPLYPQKHQSAKYSESVLIGLTKSYKINSRVNGSVQVLYDIWWKDKALNSPITIRFTTGK